MIYSVRGKGGSISPDYPFFILYIEEVAVFMGQVG